MSKCEQCIIKQVNALKSLTKEELKRISTSKTAIEVNKGDVLFKEGESLNGVYCVKDGACKLTKLSANGNDQIVKLASKGDMFGHRSLISNESANLSAIALNDMKVCFIPKAEIVNDLRKNPDFSMDMLKQMAQDLKESDTVIVDLAQKSVKQRLAELLLYMLDNFGVTEEGFLNIVLSREDYANITGAATESVIRILSQFKKENLILTERKQIKILDKTMLQNVN